MDRQTLRDWAHRYNAEGVSGLFNRRPPDPPCLLSAAQKEDGGNRAGPDPADVVRRRFGVSMSELLANNGKPGLSASVGAPAASEIECDL